MRYFVSADLGQARDYSALSVIRSGETEDVIHLERVPLNTSYVDQVNHLTALHSHVRKQGHPSYLIVDSTGVGRAVIDLLRKAGESPIAISITGGDKPTITGYDWHIPKRDLIHALISAFQSRRLKIARSLPYAETLTRELLNFKLKLNSKGHDTYNAGKDSIHDDLLMSVAQGIYASNTNVINVSDKVKL